MLARCARCQGTFTTDHFGRNTCPHCGSELILADPNEPRPTIPAEPGGYAPPPPPGSGWAPPPGAGWTPPQPPPPEPELASPFAEVRQRGFFRAFFETWKLVAIEPRKFFGHVRLDALAPAVIFGVLAAWVGYAIAQVFQFLTLPQMVEAARRFLPPGEMAPLEEALRNSTPQAVVRDVLLAPLVIAAVLFAFAAVVHGALVLFGGATRGFRATLLVVFYSAGTWLLLALPGCGSLVAIVWQLVVLVTGIAAAQRCSVGKAAGAVLPVAFLFCCGFLTMLAAPGVKAGMAAAHHATPPGPVEDL